MTTHASTSVLASPNRLAEQFMAAIDAASLHNLDGLARKLWAAHGAGIVGDDQTQQLQEMIQRRRGQPIVVHGLLAATPAIAPRYFIERSLEQRSPDRRASLLRHTAAVTSAAAVSFKSSI